MQASVVTTHCGYNRQFLRGPNMQKSELFLRGPISFLLKMVLREPYGPRRNRKCFYGGPQRAPGETFFRRNIFGNRVPEGPRWNIFAGTKMSDGPRWNFFTNLNVFLYILKKLFKKWNLEKYLYF